MGSVPRQIFSAGALLSETSPAKLNLIIMMQSFARYLRGSAIGGGLSFVRARSGRLSNAETMSVKINVLPESPLPAAVARQIDAVENRRADLGQSAADKALPDISVGARWLVSLLGS